MPGDGRQNVGILPCHISHSNNGVRIHNFIISPRDRLYRAWEIYLAALVLYTAWVSPFEFGFLEKPERPLSIVDNFVNGFFAINIGLTFFVAYPNEITNVLVVNHKRIAWRYTSTWLLFDVVSTIPSELTGNLSIGYLQSYGLFNMFRLWRLHRVNALYARMEKDRNFNYFWVRMAKLLFVTLFWVNCASCFYYRLAANYRNPGRTWIGYDNTHFKDQSLGVLYVTSMYWSVTTLVGDGTFNAQNTHEMIFVICYVLFNFGFAAYLIGNITILAVHGYSKIMEHRATIQAALGFAQRHQLSDELQGQMFAHFDVPVSELRRQQEAIDSLSNGIRSKIYYSLFHPLLKKAYLFRGVSNELLFQLVSEIKGEYFPPKADVILQMAAPTDFYLVVNGAMELLIMNNGVEEVVGETKPGDLFGEIGFLCNRPQLFTVRAKESSHLLRFNRSAFFEIVRGKVGDGTVIVNNLLQLLKDMDHLVVMEGVLLETEDMLARGRMDLPLSLCFATLRGYNLLLRDLLKKGFNPNEADNNGRTALHIAVSKGSEKCVLLLLNYGADPNCTDSDGNVPLWEAILGKHETVVRLLADHGATLSSGDVAQFSCIAAEQNNLDFLKQIISHGGDVTRPKYDGSTALHVAVYEGNTEMVKSLLDQGANIDKQNHHGWTPRELADLHGHEDIKTLFLSPKFTKYRHFTKPKPSPPPTSIPEDKRAHDSQDMKLLRRFKSEPKMT